jgi:uncharacterized protein involved in exopolysaccharide biosynthesis
MVEASLRLQALLTEGQGQLAGLKETYSEDNYRVKAAEARNAEIERQIRQMGGGAGTPDASGGGGNAGYPSVSALPGLGLTYFDLERRVRVDEALWETLTKQYEMARVQEAREIPTIRVFDTANIPSRKAGPKRSVIVLSATLISFLLSCAVVFCLALWEQLDDEALPRKLYARFFKKTASLEQ